MKKSVLSLLLAVFCLITVAQPGQNGNNGNDEDVQLTAPTPQPKMHSQPQGHNFVSSGNITMVVVSPNNERFWLYVNNRLQTRQSGYLAKVDINPNFIYSIQVVMDNRSRDRFSANVCLGGNGTNIMLTIERTKGFGFFQGNYCLCWNGQKINPGHGNYAYIWTDRSSFYNNVRIAGGMDFYPINPTGQPTPQPNVQPTPPYAQPCSNAEFMRIKALVKDQKFEKDRMNVALQAVRGNMLTADQIADLARLFPFESDRLQFLKAAYDNCFDKNNYYVVFQTLDFSSSKDELTRYLQGR